MGDRAQIEIRQPYDETVSIYLYTHWAGSEVHTRLANALRKGKSRWSDSGYITRIIMNGLQGFDRETTGFGIGIEPHADCDNPTPVVHWGRTYPNNGLKSWQAGDGGLHVEYLGKVFSAEEFVDLYAKKPTLADVVS